MALTLATLPPGTALRPVPTASPWAAGYGRCYGRVSVLAPQGRAGALLPVAGASVRVYLPGTSTPYTGELFATATGTTPLTFPALTATDGSLELWSEVPLRLDVTVQSTLAGSARETVDLEPPPDAADPYPLYATDADLAAHKAAPDDHPGYVDPTELATALAPFATDADLAAHKAAPDEHPGYLTPAEADAAYESLTRYGAPSGYTPLDANGLVPPQHLPPIAITDTYVVMSEAEMLALPAQVGDIAIRVESPPRKDTYILAADPATTLANWLLLGTTVIAGNVTVVRRQEFAPAPGSPSVTLTGAPTEMISVTRNGVQQSAMAGDFAVAGAVLTFSTPMALGEKVVVAYSVGVSIAVDTYTKSETHALFVDTAGDAMTGPLTILGNAVDVDAVQAGNRLTWGPDGFFVPPALVQADLDAHKAAPDDHPLYATDADLAAHLASVDDHPLYATDADLAAHVADPDPHPVYLLPAEADLAYVNTAGDAMAGALGFAPDNTLDLGQPAADRPRSIYAGTNVVAGGRIGVGDGSAAAPAIYFTADSNTGFYRRGNNELAFITSGDLHWYIDTNGVLAGGSDATVDIGKATHRPRHVHLAGVVEQAQLATPATPPAGSMALYPKADGAYYSLDAAGVERRLGLTQAETDALYVNTAGGDTMDGPFVVNGATTVNGTLTGTAAQFSDVVAAESLLLVNANPQPIRGPTWSRPGPVTRWHTEVAGLEAGANAGSDWSLNRYADAGTFLGAPLTIERATGTADFEVPPTVAGVPLLTRVNVQGSAGVTVVELPANQFTVGAAPSADAGNIFSVHANGLYAAVPPEYLTDVEGDAAYVNVTGDTMTAPLYLPAANPTGATEATHKAYVDALVANANLYQGTWQVAGNVPDLDPLVALPLNGYSWIAVTVDPQVAEVAPATLPGIGGATIFNGDVLKWNAGLLLYEHIQGSSLSRAQADGLYLSLLGGTVTGSITLPGDPTANLEAATKQYVDGQVGGAVGAYLPLTGGTLTGGLFLRAQAPVGATEATHKQYVDETIASNALYQGIWDVATNVPDLAASAATNLNGYAWICQTVDPAIPESPPVNLPGVPTTTVIDSGWTIRWNGGTLLYELIRGPSLSLAGAQGFFVDLTGDTMTGPLTLETQVDHEIALFLNKTAVAGNNGIIGQRNGNNRWSLYMGGNGAETATDYVGSDWTLYRWNNAGTVPTQVLNVARATGDVTLTEDLLALQGTFRNGAAGTVNADRAQLRFGYQNQAGGTYTHEIRTQHHGGSIPDNKIEVWVHGSNTAPYNQNGAAVPNNHVIDFGGEQIIPHKPFSGLAVSTPATTVGDMTWDGASGLTMPVVTNGGAVGAYRFGDDNHGLFYPSNWVLQLREYGGVFQFNRAAGGGTRVADIDQANGIRFWKANNNNGDTTLIRGYEASGHNACGIVNRRQGFYAYGPFTDMAFYVSSGGWGYQQALVFQNGAPPTTYANGVVNAANFTNRSDRALKRDIVDLDAGATKAAFAKLRPVRYQRLAPPRIEGQQQEGPVVDEVGLVAQDVQAAMPELVSESRETPESEPMLGYSVPGVMALMVAAVQALQADLAALQNEVTQLRGRRA